MNQPVPTPPAPAPVDPRIYLAAERTLLAWVRTGVSLMGFGLILAKLRLLLAGLPVSLPAETSRQLAVSGRLGLLLVLLGVLVLVASAIRHFLYVRALERQGEAAPVRRNFGVVVAAILALAGVALAVMLIRLD